MHAFLKQDDTQKYDGKYLEEFVFIDITNFVIHLPIKPFKSRYKDPLFYQIESKLKN